MQKRMSNKKIKEIVVLFVTAVAVIALIVGYSNGRNDKHAKQLDKVEVKK